MPEKNNVEQKPNSSERMHNFFFPIPKEMYSHIVAAATKEGQSISGWMRSRLAIALKNEEAIKK